MFDEGRNIGRQGVGGELSRVLHVGATIGAISMQNDDTQKRSSKFTENIS